MYVVGNFVVIGLKLVFVLYGFLEDVGFDVDFWVFVKELIGQVVGYVLIVCIIQLQFVDGQGLFFGILCFGRFKKVDDWYVFCYCDFLNSISIQ